MLGQIRVSGAIFFFSFIYLYERIYNRKRMHVAMCLASQVALGPYSNAANSINEASLLFIYMKGHELARLVWPGWSNDQLIRLPSSLSLALGGSSVSSFKLLSIVDATNDNIYKQTCPLFFPKKKKKGKLEKKRTTIFII